MAEKVYSVTKLTEYISGLINEDFLLSSLSVSGEVSNFTRAASGHLYFTLKEGTNVLNCVMWKSDAMRLTALPKNGDEIVCKGRMDVYGGMGRYQMKVSSMKAVGEGDLMQQFEELKRKLSAEGLFDTAHKKTLPQYPRRVGVITSRTGEVIHDIINVGRRRNPAVEIVLCNSLVQGAEAPKALTEALKRMDKLGFDVLVIGRGGGSMEDLWCFNDEGLARAIYACSTPIVSSVGHEPDYTICVFVADKRAATPSEAAVFVTFDAGALIQGLDEKQLHLSGQMLDLIKRKELKLKALTERVKGHSPAGRLAVYETKLGGMKGRFDSLLEKKLLERKQRLKDMYRIEDIFLHKLALTKNRLESVVGRFISDNPANKLIGGFGYVADEKGKPLDTVDKVKAAGEFDLRMKDGSIKCQTIR